MKRVSLRTLVLMLELLVAVVAIQYTNSVRPVRASAMWLGGDATLLSPVPCEANDCTVGT